MILQALNRFYERCLSDKSEDVPEFGYAPQKIGWVLHIGVHGGLIHEPEDIREVDDKGKKHHKVMLVPSIIQKRAVNILPQFLWDNTGYVLGRDSKGKPRRAEQQFEAFRDLHHRLLAATEEPAALALLLFLDKWTPEKAETLPYWDELAGENVVFRYSDGTYLHRIPSLRTAWSNYLESAGDGVERACLITGKRTPVLRLHPAIKGVRNAQGSGASIISFNVDAFYSYGKEQNFNAPVSPAAAFGYTTALNHLLQYGSQRKVTIGDTDVLFWADEPTPLEAVIRESVDPMAQDDPEEEILLAMKALRHGGHPREFETDGRFYVLGLAGNSARIAIRFWQVDSIGAVADRIGAHFRDLDLEPPGPRDPVFPSAGQLLRETAVLGKSENIAPTLSAAFIRSVLNGGAYPQGLLSAILRRIRSDGRISYLRAALIKAIVNRQARLTHKGKEVHVKLDQDSPDVPYRLGRLFAVLERIQQDANPAIKATIKDRYFGAASASPATVYGQLLRLSQHHIQKADKRPYHEKLIQDVVGGINSFPKQLSLEEQGRFALGYYHQRQWFYTKKEERGGTE